MMPHITGSPDPNWQYRIRRATRIAAREQTPARPMISDVGCHGNYLPAKQILAVNRARQMNESIEIPKSEAARYSRTPTPSPTGQMGSTASG
jgi:hypothetical protein